MAQGLPELVGRAMIDPEFVAELQRAPEPILAEFELSDHERDAVRQALRWLAETPITQHSQAFTSALLRRVAT